VSAFVTSTTILPSIPIDNDAQTPVRPPCSSLSSVRVAATRQRNNREPRTVLDLRRTQPAHVVGVDYFGGLEFPRRISRLWVGGVDGTVIDVQCCDQSHARYSPGGK